MHYAQRFFIASMEQLVVKNYRIVIRTERCMIGYDFKISFGHR